MSITTTLFRRYAEMDGRAPSMGPLQLVPTPEATYRIATMGKRDVTKVVNVLPDICRA